METSENTPLLGIESEFRNSSMGDKRRLKRLCAVACRIAEKPGESLPNAMETPKELQGAYRLFENPAVDFGGIFK